MWIQNRYGNVDPKQVWECESKTGMGGNQMDSRISPIHSGNLILYMSCTVPLPPLRAATKVVAGRDCMFLQIVASAGPPLPHPLFLLLILSCTLCSFSSSSPAPSVPSPHPLPHPLFLLLILSCTLCSFSSSSPAPLVPSACHLPHPLLLLLTLFLHHVLLLLTLSCTPCCIY